MNIFAKETYKEKDEMEHTRYDRNILIDGFGEAGQEKLEKARVLIIGAGGLGSPVLYYLAAAGVGTLGIVDDDVVEMTNLQRQILHRAADLGISKAVSASEKIRALNPGIQTNIYQYRFTEENAVDLVGEYDFIIDCCDNYATKFLIDDVCVQQGKAYSHGAVLSLRGEVMTYTPGNTCYRDIFGSPPSGENVPSASQAGVLGSVVGVIGSIQATETIKYITGIGDLILNRILIFDGRAMNFYSLKVNQDRV